MKANHRPHGLRHRRAGAGRRGIQLPAPGFLEALRRRCDETGALLIFDEIQTGTGRTGTLYYFQQAGVTPDILCTAKSPSAAACRWARSSRRTGSCLRSRPTRCWGTSPPSADTRSAARRDSRRSNTCSAKD
ncbi:MAG: aminotransferase class III-fold pyridoxal phosphate-dependent enzyme [Alistipes indistinctus]